MVSDLSYGSLDGAREEIIFQGVLSWGKRKRTQVILKTQLGIRDKYSTVKCSDM
jgi:hypothetical protein